MEQQERRIGDAKASSDRQVMDPQGPQGEHGKHGEQREHKEQGETGRSNDARMGILGETSHETAHEMIAHDLAPEQEAVVCDAPTVADAVAWECLQALELSRALVGGRVLLLEPYAEAVGRLLRAGGFQGERVELRLPASRVRALGGWSERSERMETAELLTLAELADAEHPPLPVVEIDQAAQDAAMDEETPRAGHQRAAGLDRMIVADWLTDGHEGLTQEARAEGGYQVVVALDLSRILSPEEWRMTLLRLQSYVAPEGFLITGEPDGWVRQRALEVELLPAGLLLAADARRVETERTWRILRWQYRPNDLNRLPGPLARVRRVDLEASVALRAAMATAFREVFGGDEWGEWMRCTVCRRNYSRREYEALDPADQCDCGAERSLEAFHTLESVAAELRRDLADGENSRLYICVGEAREVEAFIWGYITTARKIAEILLPRQGEAERERLTRSLLDCLAARGVAEPETAPIYHQAYIGTVKQARSFSLPRAIFARMCQFAADRGVQLAVTATIPSINAYTLVRALGMDDAYAFPALPPEARRNVQYNGNEMPFTRLDECGVVLAGWVESLLAVMTGNSDRGIVKAIGAFMRQQRDGARGSEGAAGA